MMVVDSGHSVSPCGGDAGLVVVVAEPGSDVGEVEGCLLSVFTLDWVTVLQSHPLQPCHLSEVKSLSLTINQSQLITQLLIITALHT